MLCRLTALQAGRDEVQEVTARAQAALAVDEPPPAVLCLVAELQRTLSRYVGGMSLILRDSGALMATICLVATALGLASCPIGIGGESAALGCTPGQVPRVGRGWSNRCWPNLGAISDSS